MPGAPITLDEASSAASRGDWLSILGLHADCSERDIHRARRELQRSAHQDRGGCPELSMLINIAADNALASLNPAARWHREAQDCKEELQRSREDQQRREKELWRRREEGRRIMEERREAQRIHSLAEVVRIAHCRGSSKRAVAYLSAHAGLAFPAARERVHTLRKQPGGRARAHALIYAVEHEIAARRAAREDKWPKTVGLELRNPEKNLALGALKRRYDRAYQQLRHLRRTGQHLQAAARLTTQRLLAEAWMVLLDVPLQRDKSNVIPLRDSPEIP